MKNILISFHTCYFFALPFFFYVVKFIFSKTFISKINKKKKKMKWIFQIQKKKLQQRENFWKKKYTNRDLSHQKVFFFSIFVEFLNEKKKKIFKGVCSCTRKNEKFFIFFFFFVTFSTHKINFFNFNFFFFEAHYKTTLYFFKLTSQMFIYFFFFFYYY